MLIRSCGHGKETRERTFRALALLQSEDWIRSNEGHIKSIEELVMKLCHENNGAAIYVGRATTVYNPLFECSHYS